MNRRYRVVTSNVLSRGELIEKTYTKSVELKELRKLVNEHKGVIRLTELSREFVLGINQCDTPPCRRITLPRAVESPDLGAVTGPDGKTIKYTVSQ